LETRLTQTTSELEALREKLGPDMERARLEGAQSYRVRIEALTTARDDLQREVEARQSKIDELERADAKARARYDELRRGAEFKIQTLEQRCANAERRVLEKEASVRVAATARDAAERRCEEHEKILEKSSSQDVVITSLLAKLEQRVCELYAKADSAAKLMQTQRKGDATKMAKLQARVRAARRARDAAKTRASRLVRENEESLMRIGIMEVQLKDAERMIENANREWLAECRRRETAESVSSRAEDELGEIRAKMNALESDRAVVQRENQKSYAMALEQNVHAEERIAELTSQLEALKSDLAAASEALAAAQVDVNAATTREQSLRWKSQELESSNANLQRAIDEQRAAIDERDGVEATLAKREEELANAEARSARLDCELTDAKIDARRAREAMAKMQSELDALRAQRPASSLSSELAVVEAICRDLATPEPAKTVPGALALSPDQVQPSSTTATTTTTIIVEAPPEQKEQTRSTQPSPARRARRRANPFTDKENPDASPKLTAVPRRQHTNAPLSPLSLLGVR
jgi:chromosome segregation ATPase